MGLQFDPVDRKDGGVDYLVYRVVCSQPFDQPAVQHVALNEADLGGNLLDEILGQLVRTKRFSMTPMSVEDAILQMELLDHSFFFFFNTDTEEYAVAYRRNDGGYGVIEPETA